MAKKQIQGGLSGLLKPTQAPTPTAQTSTAQEPVQVEAPTTARQMKSPRGTTVRVCYNLNAEIVKKAKAMRKHARNELKEIEQIEKYREEEKYEPHIKFDK